MTIKTIFLDRDGVINKEINYLHKIEDFEFISGVFETCRYLQNLDYQIIIKNTTFYEQCVSPKSNLLSTTIQ